MPKTLFIHRSVGHNLLTDGQIRTHLKPHPEIQFSDYDQNIDELTAADGSKSKLGFNFPEADTKPASYAKIFNNQADPESAKIRDVALEYDVIVIKSCYPNNKIKTDTQLQTLKDNYTALANFFKQHPDKQLKILTTPPLTPLMTNKADAARARQLATWLAETDLGINITVFNFYDRLADPKHGWLKRSYRRLLPVDSHPNKKASRDLAQDFVTFLVAN